MQEKSRSTIKDVAKKTGYSIQTVSRVINNSPNVNEETRKKIKEAIEELGYKPNFYARNLNGSKNINILISIKREKGHDATIWLNNLVNEIIVANGTPKISIFVEQFYEDLELERSLLYTTSNLISGVIIFYAVRDDERIRYLRDNRIPYIIFGKSESEEDVFVASDDYNSVMMGTRYLFSRGIRRIDFITANELPVKRERESGIADAYKEEGIGLENLSIIKGMYNQEKVYNTVLKKIAGGTLPEAFYVSGDEKAIGILRALNENNIRIPEEVMVLGYDNIPISEYYYPSLSTIDLDYRRIADRLFSKILSLVEGNHEESEFIKGKLIIRNSTR